jgi:hypothetical protein
MQHIYDTSDVKVLFHIKSRVTQPTSSQQPAVRRKMSLITDQGVPGIHEREKGQLSCAVLRRILAHSWLPVPLQVHKYTLCIACRSLTRAGRWEEIHKLHEAATNAQASPIHLSTWSLYGAIDYRCGDRLLFLVPASCMTNSNPDFLSSSNKHELILGHYLNELDVRKLLVLVSISQRS